MRDIDLIFRVKETLRAVEVTSGMHELDYISRSILVFIGKAASQRKPLKVSDIVNKPDFGTPPTVLSRLGKLERMGWIKFVRDVSDRRVKHVLLTPLARTAFTKMSAEIASVLSGKEMTQPSQPVGAHRPRRVRV